MKLAEQPERAAALMERLKVDAMRSGSDNKSQLQIGLCSATTAAVAIKPNWVKKEPFAIYKMMIDVSGGERVFLFRGPGCRTKMIQCWDDHLNRADGDA